MKCINCKTELNIHNQGGQKSYVCNNCKSIFIQTNLLSTILSDYEFKKMNHEIQRAQITSSKICPSCNLSMIKLIDLLGSNEIDSCGKCHLTWLNSSSWGRIKNDQINKNSKLQKNVVQFNSKEPGSVVIFDEVSIFDILDIIFDLDNY